MTFELNFYDFYVHDKFTYYDFLIRARVTFTISSFEEVSFMYVFL